MGGGAYALETVNLWDAIAVVVSAIVGSMGLGGGSVLILYLTLVKNTPQLLAQGINLLFFLPCAVTAVCIYWKQGILRLSIIWRMAVGGLIGVLLGQMLLRQIGTKTITALFAGFLIIAGIFTLFSKKERAENPKSGK